MKKQKTKAVRSRIDEAVALLDAIEIPVSSMTPRRRERLAMALLGAANLKPTTPWQKAAIVGVSRHNITTRQMIDYWNSHYGESLSSGSYDDVKREELDVLVIAGVVAGSAGNPNANANANDPTRGYAITELAAPVLLSFGSKEWDRCVTEFVKAAGSLTERFNKHRTKASVEITTPNGETLVLSQGPHNVLQKQIIEEFFPQFVPDAVLLYVGDATNKLLFKHDEKLTELGFFELSHETLPDVVAYSPSKNWIILVEAVHSANPIDKVRHLQMEEGTLRLRQRLQRSNVTAEMGCRH
jgi:type II restriction enzyme